jgi:hypothetical protein
MRIPGLLVCPVICLDAPADDLFRQGAEDGLVTARRIDSGLRLLDFALDLDEHALGRLTLTAQVPDLLANGIAELGDPRGVAVWADEP